MTRRKGAVARAGLPTTQTAESLSKSPFII